MKTSFKLQTEITDNTGLSGNTSSEHKVPHETVGNRLTIHFFVLVPWT